MKKPPISRTNYVHLNKKGAQITVGVKGTQKTTYDVNTVLKQVKDITEYMQKESDALARNALFPDYMLKDDPAFTQAAREVLADVLNDMGSPYTSAETRGVFAEINRLASSPKALQREFYETVRDFYQIEKNTPLRKVKKLAYKGGLINPKTRKLNKISDPERLISWILEQDDWDAAQTAKIKKYDFDTAISEAQRLALEK